jgi:hypothetical protein
MARTKSPAARSAAHAAPDSAPAPDAGAAPGSPAAAVYAALAASPDATVAMIAAAGIGRPAAREALLAMEKAGTATRAKGGRPGIPDTWTLTAGEAGAARDEPAAQAQDSPDSSDPASGAAPGDSAAQDHGAPGGTGQQDAGDAETNPGPAPDPVPGLASQPAAGSEGTGEDGGVPGGPDGEDVPDGGPQDGDGETEDGGEAGDAPDPALAAEVAGCLAQAGAAGRAAAEVLAEGGDLRTVLAGLDEVAEQAAQARRALKAALGGKKAPAARPGGLREKVLAHLRAYPGSEFTPHEVHKVLGNSSGAIANALDTLVKNGDAEVATEKPRRFRLAPAAAATAPSPAGDDGTGDEENGGTELAGAA